MTTVDLPPTCCFSCEKEWKERYHAETGKVYWYGMMYVCPICGNKRCPRASHHDNACTGSNEPGQEGSVYAHD